jgi:hypothetical protein
VVDAVAQQRLADEFEPDEAEHDGQACRQEHEPLQQAADEEIEVPQAEQREQVGGEDQKRVAGQAEDCRNGVDGEQHVRHADGDDQDEQRCGVPPPIHPGRQPGAIALGGDRHDAAGYP